MDDNYCCTNTTSSFSLSTGSCFGLLRQNLLQSFQVLQLRQKNPGAEKNVSNQSCICRRKRQEHVVGEGRWGEGRQLKTDGHNLEINVVDVAQLVWGKTISKEQRNKSVPFERRGVRSDQKKQARKNSRTIRAGKNTSKANGARRKVLKSIWRCKRGWRKKS